MDDDLVGIFEAVDSFFITPDNNYGLIGNIISGNVYLGTYINIPFNSTTVLSLRVMDIKSIRFAGRNEEHIMLFLNHRDEDRNIDWNDSALSMNIIQEKLQITKTGQ